MVRKEGDEGREEEEDYQRLAGDQEDGRHGSGRFEQKVVGAAVRVNRVEAKVAQQRHNRQHARLVPEEAPAREARRVAGARRRRR